jgi:MoxR-like ATPase
MALLKMAAQNDQVSAHANSLPQSELSASLDRVRQGYERMATAMDTIIVGQKSVLELLLSALLSGGHCLLIGVPGLAKTLMVKTLAQMFNWQFRRIQFTPDLMPSDITGTEILQTDQNSGDRVLRFAPGPIFANIILADEINRTPPKTQAALLEAMQEYHVTAAGKTMALDRPFFVIATQNPIEQEGTYPLPEAQLDRFMYSIMIDYPSAEEEERIVSKTTSIDAGNVDPTFSREELVSFMRIVRQMPVSPHVVSYAVRIARASRPTDAVAPEFVKRYVEWGAGPRAGQYLILGAKAIALLRGKSTPSSDDVRHIAAPVLQHRIIPNYNATGDGVNSQQLVAQLLQTIKEPDYD